VALLSAQGVKKPKRDWFNWAAVVKRKSTLNRYMTPETAQLWLDLAEQGKLPEWAVRQINREEMELAAL
jgi:hypothetical protein